MSITIKNGEETTEVVMEQLYTSGGQGGVVDLSPVYDAIDGLSARVDDVTSAVESNSIKTEYDDSSDTVRVTVPNSTV